MLLDTLLLIVVFAGGPERFHHDPDYRLNLGGTRFDPLLRRDLQASHSGEDLYLVQMTGPVRAAWLNDLRRDGLLPLQYIHPYTYVVYGRPAGVSRSAGRGFVRWTGWFAPEFRLLPQSRRAADWWGAVTIAVARAGDPSALEDFLRRLGGRQLESAALDDRFRLYNCLLPAEAFDAVVAFPGVYALQPVPQDGGTRSELGSQIVAGNVDFTGQAVPGYLSWLQGLDGGMGLDGSGVVLAVVDQGTQLDHDDLVARIAPCVGVTCSQVPSNHGTHVAGILVGDGASGLKDFAGFFRGLGVAPGATLVAQSFLGHYQAPGGMLRLMTDSLRNGAVISSNSWGPSSTALGYDLDTMAVDMGVRDADPEAAGNQQLTYVLAIDNGFGGSKTQGTPDEGKNILPVGSTYAQFDNTGAQRPNPFDLSNNSAHGPAQDGRFLPLVVAPGKAVESTTNGNLHGLLSGTSMAAPRVAGAAALFVERHRRLTGLDPSPALVKSALLPVALDLAGHLDADSGLLGHRFDAKQGWGRMDMAALLDPQVATLYFDGPKHLVESGDRWQRALRVADETKPVRMMLAWTDAPGSGLGGDTPAWVNDLDLAVDYGGATYAGNVFGSGGWSVSGGSHDFRNNTEGVMLGPTAAGVFHVQVNAANIAADGVPQRGSDLDQDFALTCYNCEPAPDFDLRVDEPILVACTSQALQIPVHLDAFAGFADPVSLAISPLPGFQASFDQVQWVPPATALLTVTPQVDAVLGEHSLYLTATSASTSKPWRIPVNLLSTELSPTPALPSADGLNLPLDPQFSWQAAGENDTGYRFQLALDEGFTNLIVDAEVADNAYTLPFSLEPDATYFWRIAANHPCGQTVFASPSSFTTMATQWRILLVDDDDNFPDNRPAFVQSLDFLGLDYDIWDTANSQQEPELADFSAYALVIWFSGKAGGGLSPMSGPLPETEDALETYLHEGGRLLLFAREYVKDRGGLPSLLTQYLGVASVAEDVGQTQLTGIGPLDGLGTFDMNHGSLTNLSDAPVAGPAGVALLNGDQGVAMVGQKGPLHRAAFGPFMPFTLSDPDRSLSLEALLNWMGLPLGCYVAADFDGKTAQWPVLVNVRDLLTCLNAVQPVP